MFVATPSPAPADRAGRPPGRQARLLRAPLAHTVDRLPRLPRRPRTPRPPFRRACRAVQPALPARQKFRGIGALGQLAQMRAQWPARRAGAGGRRASAACPQLRLYRPPPLASWARSASIRWIPLAGDEGYPRGGAGLRRDLPVEDDREVADTVQCVFDYPGGVRLSTMLPWPTPLAVPTSCMNSAAYPLMQGTSQVNQSRILDRLGRSTPTKSRWAFPAPPDRHRPDRRRHQTARSGPRAQDVGPGGEKSKDALYYAVESFIQCAREASLRVRRPRACRPPSSPSRRIITTGRRYLPAGWFALWRRPTRRIDEG